MDDTITREATPTNTEKINIATFDEEALSKRLRAIVENKPIEESEQPKAEAEVAPEVNQDTQEKPDVAPETEIEADSQTESAPEETAEAESEESSEPEEPKGVQKRIDKLVAKQKAAEELAQKLQQELEDAKQKLEQLDSKPSRSSEPRNPVSNITDAKALQDEYLKARSVRRWCEDNPDGCVVDGHEYSSEDVKRIKRTVEDAIEVHIPKRAEFLKQFQHFSQEAVKVYPFWKDRSSPDYAEAMEYVNNMPELKERVPGYQIIVGDLIEGRKAREARLKAASKPAPKPVTPPKPQPGIPKIASTKQDAKAADANKIKQKFLRSGSVSDLAELLKI